MAINDVALNILARIHKQNINKVGKEMVGHFEKIGQDSGDALSKKIEAAAPRVRRALHTAADATSDYERKIRSLTKAEAEREKVAERVLQLEAETERQKRRNRSILRSEEALSRQLGSAKKREESLTETLRKQEEAHEVLRRKHIRTADDLRRGELVLMQMRKDGERNTAAYKNLDQALMDVRRANADETTKLATSERNLAAIRDELSTAAAESRDLEKDLNAIRREQAASTRELESAEEDAARTRERLTKIDENLVEVNEDVAKSYRRREEAIKRVSEAENVAGKRHSRRSKGASTLGNILTDLPGVPSGPAGAWIGGGVLLTLASVAEAAVTASQAIGLLPAITVAAGAGFGTLALGVSGFADTVKEMGDPEKFAELIQGLSPAAQQAALEIKWLVDGPLGDLKAATQETLFEGVAGQFRNLVNQFLPSTSRLTQGISGSFNNMFGNFSAELLAPDSVDSINRMFDNIITGFRKAEGASAPLVDAFLRISEVGSSFLPEIGQGITNMANTFADFIKRAQANGGMERFFEKGLEAAQALGDVFGDLINWIYETFGNKSPDEFRASLDGVIATAKGIIEMIQGAANAVNDFMATISPVVTAMGGWENVIKGIGAAFIAWKTAGAIAAVAQMTTALGGVGTALSGLPALASAAAAPLLALLGTGVGVAATLAATSEAANTPAWRDAKGLTPETNPGLRGVPIGPVGPFGPGTPAKPPNLPATPGAQPPGSPSGNPLDIFAPTTPTNGKFDYRSWYPQNDPPPPAGAGLPPFSPHDVPAAPDTRSASERKDDWLKTINPDSFMPQVGTLPPGMPGPASPTATGPGHFEVDPREVFDANNKVLQQARDVRDARIELAYLQQDATATEWDVLRAKEKLQDEETQFYNAQLDLAEAQQGSFKKASKAMEDFGVDLDQDFGISKGLGGILENIVKFVGSLATAPLMGALSQIAGTKDPAYGSGLLGIAAAPFVTPSQYPGYGSPGYGMYSQGSFPGMFPPPSGMKPSILKDTGSVPSGPQSQYAAALIEQMFGSELRGPIGGSRDNNTAKGTHDAGLSIDIPIGPDQMELGDRINAWLQANASRLGLEYSIWRDQGKYPGGGGFTAGGHQNHIDAHFNGQGIPYGPGMQPPMQPQAFNSFGAPGSKQATANMIFQMAMQRGYSPHEAQSIVAYAIGESGLNPGISGGVQGDDEVIGLFQQKSAFARGGGIDPSMRADPVANTTAYLNQLEKNRHLPIEQALPATSVGGPLASGPGAQPQDWGGLMNQAAGFLGLPGHQPSAGWMPTPGAPPPPLPGSMTGGRGEGPIFGMPQGVGAGFSPQGGLGQSAGGPLDYGTPAPYGSSGWQPNSDGGVGMGGLLKGAISSAISAAGSAGDMAGGMGGGQAAAMLAQLAMQAIDRSIKFGSELAGIAGEGLVETFGNIGGASLSEGWLGRAAGAIAGVGANVGNVAGATMGDALKPKGKANPNDPNAQPQQQGQGKQGPNVAIENFNVRDSSSGAQISKQLAYDSYAAGRR